MNEKSYNGVIQAIKDKISKIKTCDTVLGNDMLMQAYQKLNESTTPILELKEFITSAEQLAADDVTLMDVVDFIRKEIKDGNLNFLVNLSREEHLTELAKSFHPAPEQTIAAFKNMFDASGESLENAIKNGVFDSLKSGLMGVLKKEYGGAEVKHSDALKSVDGKLVKYPPVGIRYEDKQSNKVVHLMENAVIEFDPETQEANALTVSQIQELNILPQYRRMMQAIQSLKYDPEDESFSLNEQWDFECKIKDGACFVNEKEIKKEDLSQLLLESVNTYQQFPDKVRGFNRNNYLTDADNMIMLFENIGSVIKYDNLETVKNLNENQYMIFDVIHTINGSTPKIVAASDHNFTNKLFESYRDMALDVDKMLGKPAVQLFESQIIREQNLIIEKQNRKAELTSEIQSLNENIQKLESIRKIAETGSPSSLEAGRRLLKLNESLNDKISQLENIDETYKL